MLLLFVVILNMIWGFDGWYIVVSFALSGVRIKTVSYRVMLFLLLLSQI